LTEKELSIIEQKTVMLYDDELIAIRADDGHIYVSLRHLCEALGLARQGQVRRIRDNDILSEGYKGGNILLPPSLTGRGGGRQKAGLLRVDLVPLWLTGVSINAVKEEVQDKLKRFQREAAKVLWEAFQEGRLTADLEFDALIETAANKETVQAYHIAQAVMKLARQQLLLEARLSNRLDAHEYFLADHEERLENIESSLGDTGRNVTPDQASQISQAVKAVALAAGKKSGRNEFGAVYGEMYRKFGVTGYKLLPAKRFRECMEWLTEWHENLISDSF